MQNCVQSSLLKNYIAQNDQNKPVAPQGYAVPSVLKTDEDEYISSKKQKKQKTAKILLFSALALGAGTGIVAAFWKKGGSTNIIDKILKQVKRFTSFGGEKAKNTAKGVKTTASNMSEYQKGANNFTNVKDTFSRRLLSRIPGYNKFDNWCSNLYKKSCLTTVDKSYQKASSLIKSSSDEIINAAKKSDFDETSLERLQTLVTKKQNAVSNFAKTSEVTKRFNQLDDSMLSLDKDAAKSIIGSIKEKGIKGSIKEYSKKSIVEDRLVKSAKLRTSAMQKGANAGLTEAESKELKGLLGKIKNQEVLKNAAKADKAFEKAYAKEGLDLFEKLRDINCGSAPTDILSMAGTAGLFGLYAAQADTKEERTGVVLTTGVPLGVTLGTTLFATIKMVSGIKALGLGMATGFVTKLATGAANKQYKKSKGIEEVPKSIVTIEDCQNELRSKLTNIGQ
ncbi:MAG: hypothetical protein LUE64_06840 [Candidatus Gastranaerophilales bacterium]|nr:hypothetical protein [Candidatus Gastranaerophilales bacterium]